MKDHGFIPKNTDPRYYNTIISGALLFMESSEAEGLLRECNDNIELQNVILCLIFSYLHGTTHMQQEFINLKNLTKNMQKDLSSLRTMPKTSLPNT